LRSSQKLCDDGTYIQKRLPIKMNGKRGEMYSRYFHQSSHSQGLNGGEIFFLLDDGMKRKV
jgi:hypothetical protein